MIPVGILTAAATSSFSYLLNDYPNAAAAYSVRKLRAAYTGFCMQVRRSSDNATQDIGFVNNVLDTTTLLTFCGIGNGTISIWYDQSGNNLNLSQIVLNSQPLIVLLGNLYLINGKPAVFFSGATASDKYLINNSLSISQPNTTIVVTKTTSVQNGKNLFDGLSSRQALFANGSNLISFFAGNVQSSTTSWGVNATKLINTFFNGASSVLYSNNISILTANTGTNSLTNFYLGGFPSGNSFWDGLIPEIILYANNQTSNLNGINNNINTFYTIY